MALADLFEKNSDLLAAIESLDNGKALSLAKVDIGMCAGTLRYYGGWADKIVGKVIEVNSETFNYTRQEPVSRMEIQLSVITMLIIPRSASAPKSSHGISHCSCGHGRSAPPSPVATP